VHKIKNVSLERTVSYYITNSKLDLCVGCIITELFILHMTSLVNWGKALVTCFDLWFRHMTCVEGFRLCSYWRMCVTKSEEKPYPGLKCKAVVIILQPAEIIIIIFPFWLLSSFRALLLETMFEELPKVILGHHKASGLGPVNIKGPLNFFPEMSVRLGKQDLLLQGVVYHPAYMS